MAAIKHITAREILDSRGNPTVEVTVTLDNGSQGSASCPSGASTGMHEAVELRDNDPKRYNGKGVLKAVQNIENIIAPKLKGKKASDQKTIDDILVELDGTPNKAKLGANATLSVSIAVTKAQSAYEKLPVYKYIQKLANSKSLDRIPTPLFNILNGGKHAGGNIDFQEFMVIPNLSDLSYKQGLERGVLVYTALKKLLEQQKFSTLTGDEGGFGPTLSSNQEALSLIRLAIGQSGLVFGKDINIGLDVASGSFYENGKYHIREKPGGVTAPELIDIYLTLNKDYQFLYLEDPLSEDDWESWVSLSSQIPHQTMIVGDDLLVTNPRRLQTAIEKKAANGIIVKPNQIGTISETLEVVQLAKQHDVKTIVSHRSGETNDSFIADFAVGVGSDFVKFGAPARGERVAKYNRLLTIEEEL